MISDIYVYNIYIYIYMYVYNIYICIQNIYIYLMNTFDIGKNVDFGFRNLGQIAFKRGYLATQAITTGPIRPQAQKTAALMEDVYVYLCLCVHDITRHEVT